MRILLLFLAASTSAEILENGCHSNFDFLLEHESSCTQYYRCSHGQKLLMHCDYGKQFSFISQGCYWMWSPQCNPTTKIPENEEGSGFGGLLGGEFRTLPTTIIEADEVVTARTTEEFSETYMDCYDFAVAARRIPYTGDCQRYWRCVGGVPQSFLCSNGLFFNAKTEACDFKANVKCNLGEHDELQGEFIVYK